MLESSDYDKPGLSVRLRQRLRLSPSRNMFWSWYEPRNFGDWIGPYLFEKITGRAPHFLPKRKQRLGPFFLTAGSILPHVQVSDVAVVWGSGIINARDVFARPCKTLAVRGPRSQERLRALGFSCPDVVGDPGILLPLHYRPSMARVSGRIGVIPHFVDLDLVRAQASDSVHVIDVTRPVEKVVDEIATCSITFSSSLHGIIVSHAYDVPSVWCSSLNPIKGDGTKFHDYLESTGIWKARPVTLPRIEAAALNALAAHATLPDLSRLQATLAGTCPFQSWPH